MNVWILFILATVVLQVSAPQSNTGLTGVKEPDFSTGAEE